MLIYDQFGIIQNLQMSPIPQTSHWSWAFFAVSYSKPALMWVYCKTFKRFFFSISIGSFSAWKDGRCHFKGFWRGGRAEMFTRYKRLQRFPTTQVNNVFTVVDFQPITGQLFCWDSRDVLWLVEKIVEFSNNTGK